MCLVLVYPHTFHVCHLYHVQGPILAALVLSLWISARRYQVGHFIVSILLCGEEEGGVCVCVYGHFQKEMLLLEGVCAGFTGSRENRVQRTCVRSPCFSEAQARITKYSTHGFNLHINKYCSSKRVVVGR